MTTKERFDSKIQINNSGCWIWEAATDKDGYGYFNDGTRNVRPHRYAWEITNGKIPKGLYVLHKCDNPPCCNPDHLFLGTAKDNIDDCLAKGRFPMGKNHYMNKLTDQQVTEIRDSYPSKTQTQLAKDYQVSQGLISLIIRNERRKDI